MGVFFTAGETKTRPGVYQRYENANDAMGSGLTGGIVAAVFRANWGPIGKVLSFLNTDDVDSQLGSGGAAGTVRVLKEIFKGGAKLIKAVRLGGYNDVGLGAAATVNLKDSGAADAITVTAKYKGDRAFKFIIRTMIGSTTHKEFVLYESGVLIESLPFAVSADGEVDALIVAAAASQYVTMAKVAAYAGTGAVAAVAVETALGAGTNPTIADGSYSDAFVLLEPHIWNVLALDTEDTNVHALVDAYINRVFPAGKMGHVVLAEQVSVALATRQDHAEAFNDYKIVYVGGGFKIDSELIDGYKAAARIAGLIASMPSNQSLTHKIIEDATEVAELLTDQQYIDCTKAGMLTFSVSNSGQVWIESAITTLVTPTDEDDEGWKKIKRSRIRFEMMTRVSDVVDLLIGKVNNTADGRANIIQAVQGVLNDMTKEEKLYAGATVAPDTTQAPAGDSAWFVIDADDIDALERTYFKFRFRFAA